MRTELANLNHCAVPYLSRAAAGICLYCYTFNRLIKRLLSQAVLVLQVTTINILIVQYINSVILIY